MLGSTLEPPPDVPETDGADFVPREFRVAAMYRRCCLYLVVGSWFCFALAALLPDPNGQPRDLTVLVFVAVFFVFAPPLLWLYAATYRLRLDEHGLSRRRLWFWQLWPWEAFAEGKITFDIDNALLTCRDRPLWDRWLSPAMTEPQDLEFVLETLRRVVPADCQIVGKRNFPPEPPDEITLGLALVRKLKVDRHGCELLGRQGWKWDWNEIAEFRIEQTPHGKYRIYRLFIVLQARTCHPETLREFRGGINLVAIAGVSVQPTNSRSEEWLPLLQTLVPTECWQYFSTQGELQSLAEGEFRLKHWGKAMTTGGWLEWTGWAMLPLAAWVFVPKIMVAWNMPFLPWGWKLVAIVCLVLATLQPTVMLVALTRHIRHKFQQHLTETQRQMAELAGGKPCPVPG